MRDSVRPLVNAGVWMLFRRAMMSLESGGRVRRALRPEWVSDSQCLTMIPLQRGSPYRHLSIKNLLLLQWDCGSAGMDSWADQALSWREDGGWVLSHFTSFPHHTLIYLHISVALDLWVSWTGYSGALPTLSSWHSCKRGLFITAVICTAWWQCSNSPFLSASPSPLTILAPAVRCHVSLSSASRRGSRISKPSVDFPDWRWRTINSP